ncbi:MAG: DegT/DnrJ/EryC1/StrS family aminotransferase [Candidatus Omnitrophica bacterium]|nr:DegT/DnrJ/EryC1/StrS family aminotransferase [Candidatus Omnitrophota bacterium]
MIPVAKPYLNDDEIAAVKEVIASGWVTQGPKVAEFEEAFKEFTGSPYACAVSNCTSALHLALQVMGVHPGDVVVTVSHSFIATANAVRMCSAEPVFVDIDPATFNMSVEKLSAFLQQECEQQSDGLYYKNVFALSSPQTPFNHIEQQLGRVSAILVVHQMGLPCDLAAILPIAKKYGLPVIEDAACAIGSEISLDGGETFEKIGRPHGDIACFSFHPRKVMTTGEGGMITSRDAVIDRQLKRLRHQGMEVSDLERHQSKTLQFESYSTTAYNYRMTDIQAAMGIEQLKKLPQMVVRRREIVAEYCRRLGDIKHIQCAVEPHYGRSNWQSFTIRILPTSPRSRDEVMQFLMESDIATRRGIMNSHQEEPYRNEMWTLPASEEARDNVIILPLYYKLSDKGLDFIVEQLKAALGE